jgi:hypothetical protein
MRFRRAMSRELTALRILIPELDPSPDQYNKNPRLKGEADVK